MDRFDSIDNRRADLRTVLGSAARHSGALLMGCAFVAGFGALIYSDSASNPRERRLTPALGQSAVMAVTEEESSGSRPLLRGAYLAASMSQAASSEPAEVFVLTECRKALIGDYSVAVEGTGKNGDGVLDPDNFTVPMPEDRTVIYYPVKGDPQGLSDTRDISGEYYTVYDENSGSRITLSAFEIVCQIVNNEIGDSWSSEAIKAQAVAAYSYVRFGYSIGITPSVGLKAGYSSKLESCVRAVEGQAMYYDGKVINAVYSASTAGYSTCSKDIWGADRPYLRCVESEYDDRDPNWDYEKSYTKDQVREILEDRFNITMSDNVTEWFTVDRVYSVRYVDSFTINKDSSATISGNGLCNLFGLKSNAIEISFKDGVFTFKSCGWGHGVGMSQWGTKYYADAGWTYDQILKHYYLGADLALSSVDTNAGAREEEPEEDSSSEAEVTETAVTTNVPAEGNPPADDSTETEYTEPAVTTVPAEDVPEETQYTEPEYNGGDTQTDYGYTDTYTEDETVW